MGKYKENRWRCNISKFKIKKIKLIILIAIVSFICGYLFLNVVSGKIKSKILKYCRIEAKRLATAVINSSANEIIARGYKNDELIYIYKNSNNEIDSIDFNTQIVNEILKKITINIQKKLIDIEEGNVKNINIAPTMKGSRFRNVRRGVVTEVPFGSVTGNSLLSSTGPIIPIKMSFIGKVNSQIITKIKSYGINSAYVEVDVVITVTERVSLPTATENIDIEKKIPVIMKIVQGKIPDYYNSDNIQKESNDYALPLDN